MKLFGIKISVHWSWWLLVLLFSAKDLLMLDLTGFAISFSTMLSLVVIIIMHELAHAISARYLGHEPVSITLHLMGGVALINMNKPSPSDLFWISLAGPASNMVALLLIYLTGIFSAVPLVETVLLTFGFFNLLVGLLNLLPAWPMDGGRMLRAAMAGYDPRTVMDVSHFLSGLCVCFLLAWGLAGPNLFAIILAAGISGLIWFERKSGRMIEG